METFTYFWLSYSDKKIHIDRIPVVGKNIDDLFCMGSELLESHKLHLILLLDGTLIYDKEHLDILENAKVLIAYTEEQMCKLSIYFDTKKIFGI